MGVGNLTGAVTRNLAPMFDERKGARASKNWLAFTGRGGGIVQYNDDVNEIKYEIVRGNRRVAKLIKRVDVTSQLLGENQKNIDGTGYTEVSRAFPLSMEVANIPASKLTEKIAGEPTDNSDVTRQFRLTYHAARKQTDLMSAQIRMANYLAGQGILEGVQDAIIGTSNTDEQYDFYRKATHLKTLSVPWSTITAKPLEDLDTGCDVVIADSGVCPEFALMGDLAISAMFKTTEFANAADNRTFSAFTAVGGKEAVPGKFDFLVKNGWECRGYVITWKGRKIWLFGSEELAEFTIGTTSRSMPSKKVLLGNTESRLDAQFGPSAILPETASRLAWYREMFGFMPGVAPKGEPKLTSGLITPRMFILDAYGNEVHTNVSIRSQMSPLYVPVATDEWYTIQNASV